MYMLKLFVHDSVLTCLCWNENLTVLKTFCGIACCNTGAERLLLLICWLSHENHASLCNDEGSSDRPTIHGKSFNVGFFSDFVNESLTLRNGNLHRAVHFRISFGELDLDLDALSPQEHIGVCKIELKIVFS